MPRVATVLAIIVSAVSIAGCGGFEGTDRAPAADAKGFKVLTRADALPQGHPVCPAGRRLLERGFESAGDGQASAQGLIST
jgi:hypothetical protein